jgi:transcription initiation factor TFIIIB Brf1 subunit/transcription initiation factor TFIIB
MAKCKHCGSKRNLVEIDNGEFVCNNCYTSYHYILCRCGRVYLPEEGKERCNICEGRIYEYSCNDYSTKPRTEFKFYNKDRVECSYNNQPKKRYFGLEMEYSYVDPAEVRSANSKLYNDRFLYNKRDSSLYGGGVEIVTAPMDIDTIKKYFIKEMVDIFSYIETVDDDEDVSYNAGVHIHVNKNSIPPMDLYKVHALLNLHCTDDERKVLYYLCGRSDIYGSCDDHYFAVGSSNSFIYKKDSNRHIALNTRNSNTFEFRLFKSTYDCEVLLSYIELVEKLLEFAHLHGIVDMRISNFILWLNNNTKDNVLCNKIKNIFEIYKLNSNRIIVNSKDMIIKLKGISYKDYPKLVSYIEDRGARSLTGLNRSSFLYYSNWSEGEPTNCLSKKLLEVYKKVLISKIMKEVKRCA